ncbi:MAG: hypothetical protein ABSH50_21535 [Bryobacteraceae bacterium]|jgi:hypothetical protein
MNKIFRLAIGALFALLPASIALAQQDYIGRYDVYTGYMYLNSPLISLGESGFHTQIGTNPTKWYSMGLDFSSGYGSTTLVPSMLKTSVQQAIATQLGAYGISPTYPLAVPMQSRSQTYAMGPQLNYRHFRKVTLFIHPDLGAIHEDATPHANDTSPSEHVLTTLLIEQMAPSGIKSDWVGFYGFGGGIDVNPTRHVGLKVHVDFVHDRLFPDLLNGRNSVRLSIGPLFHFGRNLAASK